MRLRILSGPVDRVRLTVPEELINGPGPGARHEAVVIGPGDLRLLDEQVRQAVAPVFAWSQVSSEVTGAQIVSPLVPWLTRGLVGALMTLGSASIIAMVDRLRFERHRTGLSCGPWASDPARSPSSMPRLSSSRTWWPSQSACPRACSSALSSARRSVWPERNCSCCCSSASPSDLLAPLWWQPLGIARDSPKSEARVPAWWLLLRQPPNG